jgi:hypothetical protein
MGQTRSFKNCTYKKFGYLNKKNEMKGYEADKEEEKYMTNFVQKSRRENTTWKT